MFICDVYLIYTLSLIIIMIFDINFDDVCPTCLTCITVWFEKHEYRKIVLLERTYIRLIAKLFILLNLNISALYRA